MKKLFLLLVVVGLSSRLYGSDLDVIDRYGRDNAQSKVLSLLVEDKNMCAGVSQMGDTLVQVVFTSLFDRATNMFVEFKEGKTNKTNCFVRCLSESDCDVKFKLILLYMGQKYGEVVGKTTDFAYWYYFVDGVIYKTTVLVMKNKKMLNIAYEKVTSFDEIKKVITGKTKIFDLS